MLFIFTFCKWKKRKREILHKKFKRKLLWVNIKSVNQILGENLWLKYLIIVLIYGNTLAVARGLSNWQYCPPFLFFSFLCYFFKTKLTINIHELYFCHTFLHFYILHINFIFFNYISEQFLNEFHSKKRYIYANLVHASNKK